MSCKDDYKARRRAERKAKSATYPLPKDEVDRRFAEMDGGKLYFEERDLDFTALGHVLAHPLLGNVRELWIDSAETLDDRCLALLVAAPLEKLEVLGVRGWKLNESALPIVLDATPLRGLRELVLSRGSGNPWPYSSVRPYFKKPLAFPTAAKLESLSFGFPCKSAVAGVLATHAALEGLQTLYLLGTQITDTEAAILASGRNLMNLRSINLSLNDIKVAGAKALAAAPWPSLETLELSSNHLGAEGMAALGARSGLPMLRELTLACNDLPVIEWVVKVSGMSEADKEQWRSDYRGQEPPTQDYIERRTVSASEITERFFPGQSVKITA